MRTLRRLLALAVTASLGIGGTALAMSGLLGIDDIGYAPTFTLTSVKASLLGQ
jgi:hypothetical protein